MCNQQFTADNPEQGLWWHALDGAGREAFEQAPDSFGRATTETLASPNLKGVLCIRCRPARDQVAAWLPSDNSGAILAVDPTQLQPDDVFIWPATGDIHVRAAAAVAAGTIMN